MQLKTYVLIHASRTATYSFQVCNTPRCHKHHWWRSSCTWWCCRRHSDKCLLCRSPRLACLLWGCRSSWLCCSRRQSGRCLAQDNLRDTLSKKRQATPTEKAAKGFCNCFMSRNSGRQAQINQLGYKLLSSYRVPARVKQAAVSY